MISVDRINQQSKQCSIEYSTLIHSFIEWIFKKVGDGIYVEREREREILSC